MGFAVIKADHANNGGLTSDRRLYLTADEGAVVEDGDLRARFLLAGPGGMIERRHVEKCGLTVEDGKVVVSGRDSAAPSAPTSSEGPESESEAETKQVEEHEDKQRTPAENKGGGKRERR